METQLRIYTKDTISLLEAKIAVFLKTLDIYYQPEFLACDAKMQNGEYEIAVCSKEDQIWIYPYILLPIEGTGYFDLSSPYGYAGPVSNSTDITLKAEELFLEYISNKQTVVTEFVRYHYLYNEQHFFQREIANLLNRRVVLVPTQDQENIWMKEFSGTNRNLVRKLEKESFTWSVAPFTKEDVPAFDEAYRTTMIHSGADDFYFFSKEFYLEMIDKLGEKLLLAKVEKENEIYSSALFFVSGGIVTYYLSARNLNYPKVPGSNLLLSKMAFWAQENRMNILNFGGGLSLDENDHLFKFKSNFGKQVKDFHIGKRIHQPELYKKLQDQFIAKKGVSAYQKVKHILQFYR
nr:peptidoglycan bridge formation glycyltransferase FemA/FemB family protein [uncultured Fluviicola sp.]